MVRMKSAGKAPSGGATRRPPEPHKSHAEIDAWFRSVMPALNPVLKALDKAIRKASPDLEYAVKWKRAYYGLPGLGWIIELAAYDVSVNVVFFGGADFDPPPLLGSTGRTRYVKVKSVDEARTPELRRWLAQAVRVRGWS